MKEFYLVLFLWLLVWVGLALYSDAEGSDHMARILGILAGYCLLMGELNSFMTRVIRRSASHN